MPKKSETSLKINKTNRDNILKFENQLCFPLYAASRLIIQAYGPMLNELKLTYPQYLVLLVLWTEDGQNVTEIGNKLLLDSGTLTPLLKKMSIAGWILRKRSNDDERAVRNYLTKKAESIKTRAAELSYGLFCQSHLEASEVEELKARVKSLILKIGPPQK